MHVLRHMFPAQKEKGLVLHERAACAAAEVGALVLQVLPAGSPGEADGFIAEQAEDVAVQSGPARPGVHAHSTGRTGTGHNAHQGAINGHLLYRPGCEMLRNSALGLVPDFNPIQGIERIQASGLVYGKRQVPGLGRVQHAAILHENARLQLRCVPRVLSIYRHAPDGGRVNLGAQSWRSGIDVHQLAVAVGSLPVPYIDEETIAAQIPGLDQDGVAARVERSGGVLAIFVGGQRQRHLGRDRVHEDGGPGNGSPRLIDDGPLNRTFGEFLLSKSGGYSLPENKKAKKTETDQGRHRVPSGGRSTQFRQTLFSFPFLARGYAHMESLPAGMVAFGLQSRIGYLTRRQGYAAQERIRHAGPRRRGPPSAESRKKGGQSLAASSLPGDRH